MSDPPPLGVCAVTLSELRDRPLSFQDHFTVTEYLGQGVFGLVVKAERHGRQYACKLINPYPTAHSDTPG
ncbi:hypothetical protein KIPB_014519, partial [Kipferlia bialata]|eukprot:g14519.t1